MWFFKICWSVNCLIKITRSKGVLSSEFSSSTRIKGSSSNYILILMRSKMLKPEDSMLFRKCAILCLSVSILSLCWSHISSVIAFKFGATISSPKSFNKIINTFFSWGIIVLLEIDSFNLSHWIISMRACINNDIFWKKGFLSWMSL